jgi:hypothetical protein
MRKKRPAKNGRAFAKIYDQWLMDLGHLDRSRWIPSELLNAGDWGIDRSRIMVVPDLRSET